MSVTGVLLSHPESRDLHLGQITMRYHGAELLVDAKCELNCGRRYGLLGANGCGTSQFHPSKFINVCIKFRILLENAHISLISGLDPL